jgi:restriction system protein
MSSRVKKQRYRKKKSTGDCIFLGFYFLLNFALYIGCIILDLADIFLSFFLVFNGIIILLTIGISKLVKSGRRYLKLDFSQLNSLSGEEFELFLKAHFTKMGYSVSLTPKSGDYGADLILKKNGEKIIVQAKRYKGSVGISAVQEVIGAKAYYKGKKALVVTNSYFTPAAKELASKTDVTLWDGKILLSVMKGKRPKI